ncbi:MAG TPA: MFS transporter [Stellaceae bacterium]|nr:MFS transporter [Stellaceae bacterium]
MRGFENAQRALGARNYRIYTIGNAISLVGNWLQRVAVGWLAWELTHSTTWLGIVAIATTAPGFILSPIAGSLADRVDRVRMILWSQIIAMVVATAMAVLTFAGSITIVSLFLLALALGAANALNQPARLALVSNLVPPALLGSAVALNSLVFNTARFIGPAVAGLVIANGSVAIAFALNALSYVAFLIALLRLRGIPPLPPRPQQRILDYTIDGYSYAVRHPGIGQIMLLFALTAFSVRGFVELFPGFADAVFERGPQGLAWLTAVTGIGAMVGGIWMVRREGIRGMTNLIVTHTLIIGLGVLAFAATHRYWIALVALFFTGFALITTGIAAQTLVQTVVDADKRGRVMGLYGVVFRAGPSLNALLMGWISSFLGLQLTVACGAGLCLLYGVWARLRRDAMEAALEMAARSAAE